MEVVLECEGRRDITESVIQSEDFSNMVYFCTFHLLSHLSYWMSVKIGGKSFHFLYLSVHWLQNLWECQLAPI